MLPSRLNRVISTHTRIALIDAVELKKGTANHNTKMTTMVSSSNCSPLGTRVWKMIAQISILCCSRKYPYPSHERFFKLNAPPLRNFHFSVTLSFKKLGFWNPPPPWNFHQPSMEWAWIFSRTTHKCWLFYFLQQFGNKVGDGQFRGKAVPTYVYPACLKAAIRERLSGHLRDYPDPETLAVRVI